MKIVAQRVQYATVQVNDIVVGAISNGLLLLVGVSDDDAKEDADWLSAKILNLRIFCDAEGKMNFSVKDIAGEILCVSQFTLFADYKKGNRPSYLKAARPALAESLFDYFKQKLYESTLKIQSGIFGADMKVALLNDGPVTILLDSKTKN